MEKFRLVRPEKKHERQALEYLEEFYADKSETHGVGGLERFKDDYDGWIDNLEKYRNLAPNEERVPAETFFLMRQSPDSSERLVGMINIRLVLNNNLWQHGGNIGYSIRPTERRKGYNKINLFLALKFCQSRGMEVVLLDCDKNNIGSAKTMRALGGRLIREYWFQESPEKISLVQAYIIDVDAAIEKNASNYASLIIEEGI